MDPCPLHGSEDEVRRGPAGGDLVDAHHRVDQLTSLLPTERLQQRVGAALYALLEDETAWELQSDGTWKRHVPKKSDQPRSGQAALMRSARRRRRPRPVS